MIPRLQAQVEENASKKVRQDGTFSEDTFLKIERRHFEFCNLNNHSVKAFDDRINYILQNISEMKNLLDSRNIQLIVGIYPDEFQINEHLLNQLFEKFNLRREDYDVELMQKILTKYLDSNQIPYVDLLDEFRDKSEEVDLYLIRDTHWNAVGNLLAAETIFKYLVERGIEFSKD